VIFTRFAKIVLFAFGALLISQTPAHALINVDGSRNQLFVFGSVTFGYDSNIFSDATDRGGSVVSSAVGLELKRRAGVVAVNATATLSYSDYGRFSDQNSFDPSFRLELNKTSGRTTGAFTVSAYRESRADSFVNLRTNSWNFPVGLSIKYPVNDKYYFTSQTGYLRRRYVESATLANYLDYTQAFDIFYVYTSKLDLVGGYRIRVSQTSIGNDTVDHWFNVGATGGLFAKLNGTVRLGYQIRDISHSQSFTHINALAALGWPVTRKLNLTGTLTRDFNTIATGASVDSTTATLRANYAINRQFEILAGVSYGRITFLGTPPPARRDTFFSWDAGLRYKLNEHFQAGVTYTYFHNWSTFAFSDFTRNGVSFDIASRF
jgi:hypothetical protein